MFDCSAWVTSVWCKDANYIGVYLSMKLFQRHTHSRFRLSRLLARVDLVSEVIHSTGNRVLLLPHGGDFFPELFAALRAAQHSICIEFYIIKNEHLTVG